MSRAAIRAAAMRWAADQALAAERFAVAIADALDVPDETPVPAGRTRRKATRAPAEPDRPVTELDAARARKMLDGMGIAR